MSKLSDLLERLADWLRDLFGKARQPRPPAFPEPGRRVKQFGRINRHATAKEYQTPAYHIRESGHYGPFAWRGSMEGLRIDPLDFNGGAMRRRHPSHRVVVDGVWCDEVGEDAISVAPRQRVTLKNVAIKGDYGSGKSGDKVGMDKAVQVDGAEVEVIGGHFENCVRAVRAKANSVVVLRDCVFVNCRTPVKADGKPNPSPSNPFDNGQRGKARVRLVGCKFYNCGSNVEDDGGEIRGD